jgi:hypothetical protein
VRATISRNWRDTELRSRSLLRFIGGAGVLGILGGIAIVAALTISARIRKRFVQ